MSKRPAILSEDVVEVHIVENNGQRIVHGHHPHVKEMTPIPISEQASFKNSEEEEISSHSHLQ